MTNDNGRARSIRDWHHVTVLEVRREADDELCGYVVENDGDWLAMSVFGGRLRRCRTRGEATQAVLDNGLDLLADHWLLSGPGVDGEQIVTIQQASPRAVTVAIGYYSLPGVPTVTVSRTDIEAGRWQLRLHQDP